MTEAIPKMPESVKVGFRRYRIVEWEPRAAMAADRMGEFCHLRGEILVSLSVGWAEAANTLLHEIIHAIWYCYGLSDDDKQERYVNVIANGLCSVWVDNPAVIAWINDGLNAV